MDMVTTDVAAAAVPAAVKQQQQYVNSATEAS
jgi:hypothetical protein